MNAITNVVINEFSQVKIEVLWVPLTTMSLVMRRIATANGSSRSNPGLNLQQDVAGDDEGEEVAELDAKEGEGATADWNVDGKLDVVEGGEEGKVA